MAESIRVSIIDDDRALRELIADWLRKGRGVHFVSGYPDAASAIEGLPNDKPHVVLVDINLPDNSGIYCVYRLKPILPDTQFVMLTVYEDVEHIYEALAVGATGYLVKNASREELIAAIRQVHDGGAPMSSYIARKVVQAFQKPRLHTVGETLSPREWEILGLLARGYSYKEIADQLGISIPTVNTHIRRTYEKLHVHSRAQAVAKFGFLSGGMPHLTGPAEPRSA